MTEPPPLVSEALCELREQLGGDVPAGLGALREAELRDLAAAIRAAHDRQAEALADAGMRAMEKVPRLLRGPLRRLRG